MNEESIIMRIPLNASEVTHCVLNTVCVGSNDVYFIIIYDEANRFERKNKSIKGVGN